MLTETLTRFLRDHMLYMDLLVFCFAIWAYKYFDRRLFLLFVNSIVGILVVIISEYTTRFGNNIYFSYLYAPYEAIMMSAILFPTKENGSLRRLIIAAVALVVLVNALEGLVPEDGLSRYNSITYCLVNCLLGSLAIYHLLKLRYNPKIESLSSTPLFWIVLGIAIHYIGLFVVWAFMRSAQSHSMELLWHLALIREIVIYLTLVIWIIGFYTARKYPATHPHF